MELRINTLFSNGFYLFFMKYFKIIALALALLAGSFQPAQSQACVAPSPDGGITVFGFLQPQFETRFNRDDTDQSFTFYRARIGVTGTVPYDFLYYAVLETGPIYFGNAPFLLDAFITYQRFSWAQISIGQFKSPFTLEMITACHALNTIFRSSAVNNLVSPDRDMGLMVSGRLFNERFFYSLALTNGTGIGLRDNNLGKTFHSRLQVSPFDFLTLGGGMQYGKHAPLAEGVTEEDSRFRWAADMQFNFRGLSLIGEFVSGRDKGSSVFSPGCGVPPEIVLGDLNRSGFYFTAMYRTPWNIQPVFRYENWNTDIDTPNSTEHTLVFGLNYWFNEWTRVQLNYLYRAEERLEIFNDELLLQLQIVF